MDAQAGFHLITVHVCLCVYAVSFVKVNTEEQEELRAQQGVDALPTVQFFKNGTKVGEFKGSDAAKLEATVRQLI